MASERDAAPRPAGRLGELARFFAVALAALIVDLGIAWTLAELVGLPLGVAAVGGFAVAAVLNYILHEIWTFQDGARKVSARRAVKYLGALGLTLTARLAALTALIQLFPPEGWTLVVLGLATGLSFFVNYAASTLLIFRAGHPDSCVEDRTNESTPVGRKNSPDSAPVHDSGWEIPDFTAQVLAGRRHAHALVIPVINEGARIRAQLQRIKEADLPVDVIVADGGSTDGSLDTGFTGPVGVRAVLIKTGPGKLSAQLRMAYAWCLREGYAGIVTIDGNGKDGVDAVSLFVDRLTQGNDYVQGSRYARGGQAENTPLERTIGNRLIHAPLLSIAGRHWLTDTTNGFRAYSRRYLLDPKVAPFRAVFLRYELLFYLTVRAGRLGYRVCEVPVRRSYPLGEATPTKIQGSGAKWDLLKQTFQAAVGAFNP